MRSCCVQDRFAAVEGNACVGRVWAASRTGIRLGVTDTTYDFCRARHVEPGHVGFLEGGGVTLLVLCWAEDYS